MVQEFFIHPTIAIAVVTLTIITFTLKARKKKFFKAHYASGIITVSLTTVAVSVAYYFATPVGFDYFPDPNYPYHFALAIPAFTSLFTQGALGITMLVRRKRAGKIYRIHKKLSRLVVAIVPIQGAIGLVVLYLLYQRYY